MKEKLVSKWVLKKPLYIKKSDKRYKPYIKQLKKFGFCDSETWSLYSVMAEFILPRLKRFREVINGYPPDLTYQKWCEIIDKMIFSFEWILTYDEKDLEKELAKEKDWKIREERYNEGIKLFSKYFMNLWW